MDRRSWKIDRHGRKPSFHKSGSDAAKTWRVEGAHCTKTIEKPTLQKFSAVHAALYNHFNQDRHLISRDHFKTRRSAALAE